MYLAPAGQLDGFNPLKAIGRALGSTGRAIVGAVVPGIGAPIAAALDSAARGKQVTPQQAAAVAAAMPPPAAAPVATVQPPSTSPPAPSATDELMKMAMLKFMTSQPAAPAAQPTFVPSGSAPSVVVSAPSAPSAPAAAALPPWAIPAMIGGLFLVMMQSKK